MFRNIVVATDGSAHARKAIDLASELATKYQSKLILVHVLQQTHVPESVRHLLEVEHVVEPQPSQRPPTGDYSVMLASTMDRGNQASTALRRVLDTLGKQRWVHPKQVSAISPRFCLYFIYHPSMV